MFGSKTSPHTKCAQSSCSGGSCRMPTQRLLSVQSRATGARHPPYITVLGPGSYRSVPSRARCGESGAKGCVTANTRQTEYTPPRLAAVPSINARWWSGVGNFHRILTLLMFWKNGAPRWFNQSMWPSELPCPVLRSSSPHRLIPPDVPTAESVRTSTPPSAVSESAEIPAQPASKETSYIK